MPPLVSVDVGTEEQAAGTSDDARPPAEEPAKRTRSGRRSKGGGPRPYDFRRPTKLGRDHVRALQMVFETFARQWTTVLTSTLRTVAQVNVASIEQLTYDEYIGTLDNPTLMHLLSVEPLVGAAVLEFPIALAMSSVDHLLGGPGGTQPDRPLSDIESTLLRGLVERVLNEFRYAFEPLAHIEPVLSGIEYNPQFAQAATASDMVIVASFDLRVGAEESIATVCLPFAAVFPLLEISLGHGVTTERERVARMAAARAVAARLEHVPVEVGVRFRPAVLGPESLVDLAVGDVLRLPHKVSAPLSVTAADVTFAHAVAGAQGKRLACLVVPDPPADEPAGLSRVGMPTASTSTASTATPSHRPAGAPRA